MWLRGLSSPPRDNRWGGQDRWRMSLSVPRVSRGTTAPGTLTGRSPSGSFPGGKRLNDQVIENVGTRRRFYERAPAGSDRTAAKACRMKETGGAGKAAANLPRRRRLQDATRRTPAVGRADEERKAGNSADCAEATLREE
jgi:hypothetical protein